LISGDPYSALIKHCLESWDRIIPEYEVILWNAERVKDIESVWVDEAIRSGKYAFAADFVRLYALYYFGGIYLDADVEVIKSFDPLLNNNSFIGLETSLDFEAAVVGSEPGAEWVKSCLDHYSNRNFIDDKGKMDLTPLPIVINTVLKNSYGISVELNSLPMQFIHPSLNVYPPSYFSPKNRHNGKISNDYSTFCIHHLDGSWVDKSASGFVRRSVHYLLSTIFGTDKHNKFVSIYRKYFRR
jgi:mannosyltransferase OCH1-like enzyme